MRAEKMWMCCFGGIWVVYLEKIISNVGHKNSLKKPNSPQVFKNLRGLETSNSFNKIDLKL